MFKTFARGRSPLFLESPLRLHLQTCQRNQIGLKGETKLAQEGKATILWPVADTGFSNGNGALGGRWLC